MKKLLSIILTLTLLASVCCISDLSAFAKTAQSPPVAVSKDKIINADAVSSRSENKKYASGEAVVMISGTSVASSGASLNLPGASADIAVKSSASFGTKREGFSVATVKSSKLSTSQIIKALKKCEGVIYAEPNYIYRALDITNDPYSKYQWGLENTGQNGGKEGVDINPEKLWSKEGGEAKEQVVAVLDTGIDISHEDLCNKLWVNPNPKKLAGVNGFDFTGTSSSGEPIDDNGHGTHCAGIIAGEKNNEKGISGVSENTKIMALKWLDSEGYGDLEDAIAAYNYVYRAMKMGVNVVAVNNSWGGDSDSKILNTLIDEVGEAGAVSVFAAGNDGNDVEGSTYFEGTDISYSNATYPACSESEYIISVAALNENGDIASYSNYGKKSIDTAAPGTDILSCVSENTYNPGIYSKEKADSLSEFYYPDNFVYTTDATDDEDAVFTVKETGDSYFGSGGTGLDISVKNAQEGAMYAITVPYEREENAQQKPRISANVRNIESPDYDTDDILSLLDMPSTFLILDTKSGVTLEDIASGSEVLGGLYLYGKDDQWYHTDLQASGKKSGSRQLMFVLSVVTEGDYHLSLDDIAVSKGSTGEEESFGKYDFYSGTSMAAPMVTGEAALIKEKYPDMTAKEIVSAVNGYISQNEGLKDKTVTGGMIDLAKIDSPSPYIKSLSLEGESLKIAGNNFENAAVYIDDKEVSVLSSAKEEITVPSENVVNRKVSVKVVTGNGYSEKTEYIAKGEEYTSLGSADSGADSFNIISDSKYIYVINEEEDCVNVLTNEADSTEDDYDYSGLQLGLIGGDGPLASILGGGTANTALYTENSYSTKIAEHFKDFIHSSSYSVAYSSLVYYGGYLYFVADVSLTSLNNKVYAKESCIVKMSVSNGKVRYIDYDTDKILNPALAVYNNNLYIAGGISPENGEALTGFYIYRPTEKVWSIKPSLPAGRAFGVCRQVGDSLVYTLGTDGTDKCPQNLIYDGKAWRTSSAPALETQNTCSAFVMGIGDISYYMANVDYVSGGLLYTGTAFDGYGDTVKYNLNSDCFTSLNYNYIKDPDNDKIFGTVMGEAYYGIVTSDVDIFDDDIDISDDEDDFSFGGSTVYSIPIKTGMYNIKARSSHGSVKGTGYYMPGEKVTLTATAKRGYKVKSITVDGKVYKGSKATFKAAKSLTAKVSYTTLATSVKLSRTKAVMTVGKKLRLKATVKPKSADNKKVRWVSLNKKVAKVNSKGVVIAKKAGKAVIKATAADGSKKSAKCVITVKKKAAAKSATAKTKTKVKTK